MRIFSLPEALFVNLFYSHLRAYFRLEREINIDLILINFCANVPLF